MKHMFSDVAQFRRDPLSFIVERANAATEPLVALNIGFRSVYLLTDPNYIKPLLKISEDLVDKGPMIGKVRAITGDSIVVLMGEEHKRRRAVFHAILARVAVDRLTPVMASEVRRTLAEMTRAGSLDAHEFGANVALRLICIVAFGSGILTPAEETMLIGALRQIESDLADEIFRSLPPAPWTLVKQRRRRKAAKQNMELIVRRVRERAPDAAMNRSLDELQLSDRDTANEILMLLLAGHDTTGSATAWLLHAMATVPGLADRIAAEAEAVRDENGELDYTKLSSATTTIATVRETLRLYPSVYWFARGIRQDLEFGGRKLRRGTSVMVSPWLFHRSLRFWDEPGAFRLDRPYNTAAYIPFGTGHRACVARGLAMLELEIIALEVASAFNLILPQPVGPPLPAIHLVAPSMPMETRARNSTRPGHSGSDRDKLNRASFPEQDEPVGERCPLHPSNS